MTEPHKGQRGGAAQHFCNRGGRRNHGQDRSAGGAGEFTPRHFLGESGSVSGNRNSGERKPLFCVYCRKNNHQQEKCFARIKDKAPCVTLDGTRYFPSQRNYKQLSNISGDESEVELHSVFLVQA